LNYKSLERSFGQYGYMEWCLALNMYVNNLEFVDSQGESEGVDESRNMVNKKRRVRKKKKKNGRKNIEVHIQPTPVINPTSDYSEINPTPALEFPMVEKDNDGYEVVASGLPHEEEVVEEAKEEVVDEANREAVALRKESQNSIMGNSEMGCSDIKVRSLSSEPIMAVCESMKEVQEVESREVMKEVESKEIIELKVEMVDKPEEKDDTEKEEMEEKEEKEVDEEALPVKVFQEREVKEDKEVKDDVKEEVKEAYHVKDRGWMGYDDGG